MKTICDLSLTSAPRRSRLWSPSELFVDGAQGAWFDPSDLTTLFQDAAGTTPVTATGQPVGRMLDKSGNGHHAVQTSSAARPIYRHVNGRHWLEFDGIGAWMVLAAPVDIDTGQIVAGLVEPDNASPRSILLSGATSGYIVIAGSGASRSLAKNDGGTIIPVDTPGYFAMTDHKAISIRVDGNKISASRKAGGTEYTNATPAAANLNAAHVLMAFSPAGELPARIDLFGLLLFSTWLEPGDLKKCLANVDARISPPAGPV